MAVEILSHLGGNVPTEDGNCHMPDVWGFLMVKYNLQSVLDVGCGYGHAIKWFHDHGVQRTLGVDGDTNAVVGTVAPRVMEHDFSLGPPPINENFDLAWSCEFLEHVEDQFIPNFMSAFKRCKYACVTYAVPGQGGHHHVNCQNLPYWVDQFKKYGFRHDAEETAILRRTDRYHTAWGRPTLSMFINER